MSAKQGYNLSLVYLKYKNVTKQFKENKTFTRLITYTNTLRKSIDFITITGNLCITLTCLV
jgi:hypothetical protein